MWSRPLERIQCIFFALGICSFAAFAQNTRAITDRVWIFFADKPVEAASDRPDGISQRALDRRARRGDPSAAEAAPVRKEYVDALRRAGIDVHLESAWLNAVSAALTPEEQRLVKALPFVHQLKNVRRWVAVAPQPAKSGDVRRESADPLVLGDDVYGLSTTQLNTVNAIPILDQGLNGAGVRIGFLDTEYDFTHPSFSRLVSEGRLLEVRNFTGETQSNRHGQYVASVAVGYDAGQLVGPCHGAEVLAATTEVAFFERNVEEDHFVAGMEWLEREGADIVNVSLGYDFFDEGERSYGPEQMDGRTAIPSRAAAAAARLGVVVVAAAGNSGSRGASSIGSPADTDTVITAGGVNPDLSPYTSTSRGPTADGRIKPDVAAQATSVRFASGSTGYSSGSGTSFAAPMTAGVVCQLLQANPDLTPVQVRNVLRSTAHQSNAPDNLLGWGIVDAEAAVGIAVTLPSGVQDVPGAQASELWIYPQPADRSAVIAVTRAVEAGGNARMNIFDLIGRRVHSVAVPDGMGVIRVEVSDLPSGLYLVQLEATSGPQMGRMLVSR